MPDTATVNGATWTLGEGVVGVEGGKALCESTYVRAVIDAGVSDATVSANIAIALPGDYAGLAFRATDPNNFLFFRISGSSWTLGYVTTTATGSVGTVIASGPYAFASDTPYRLSATCLADSVTLTVNGAPVFAGTVATGSTGTQFGFTSGALAPFTVSDFRVTP